MTQRLATKPGRMLAGERKEQIVDVVLELVAMHGTDAVSAQLVADTIGVTQPAVFRHFPTKEALWIAVMDWLEERLRSIYSVADTANENAPLKILRRMFLDHVKLIEKKPAIAKIVLSDQLRLQYPVLQERFAAIHKIYTARIVDLINSAKDLGAVSRSLGSRDAATMFLSLIQGLGFQFSIARVSTQFRRDADHVFELYLRALIANQD